MNRLLKLVIPAPEVGPCMLMALRLLSQSMHAASEDCTTANAIIILRRRAGTGVLVLLFAQSAEDGTWKVCVVRYGLLLSKAPRNDVFTTHAQVPYVNYRGHIWVMTAYIYIYIHTHM